MHKTPKEDDLPMQVLFVFSSKTLIFGDPPEDGFLHHSFDRFLVHIGLFNLSFRDIRFNMCVVMVALSTTR